MTVIVFFKVAIKKLHFENKATPGTIQTLFPRPAVILFEAIIADLELSATHISKI